MTILAIDRIDESLRLSDGFFPENAAAVGLARLRNLK